ncbi:MAG: type VI secretion system-associated FHA domain protein TagH [Sulfurovum sp.]|nr:type VI secretion system-associated FHA domain protein TagH [Sulfurovum sp.]
MNLVLEIVSTPGHSIFEKTASFTQSGGKIGRNKYMDWVLHDPTKRISNFHAEIIFKNNQYYIIDKSSNGTFFKDPHKKLNKESEVPLTNTSVLLIGEYEIAVTIANNTFMEQNPLEQVSNKAGEDFGIPDQFFMGNSTEKAFEVINPNREKEDILSLINNDSNSSNEILPEFDTGIIKEDTPFVDHMENTLHAHIGESISEEKEDEPTTYENTPVEGNDKLFSLLTTKLGVDSDAMTKEEKEIFITEIAELLRVTVEYSKTTLQSLKTIKSYLGETEEKSSNPLQDMNASKDIFSNMYKMEQPFSGHIKNLFHELNTHNIAFYTAYTNIKLRDAEIFSPEKLYFSFERDGLLNKKLSNKKALAWDAYYEKFRYLDTIRNTEDVDTIDFENEYKSVLKTLNLGHKQ